MGRPRYQRVGARELKTRLGAYLRAVREGQTVVVTERGRPVAELRPLAAAGSRQERLALMAARGALTLGDGKPLRPMRPVAIKGAPVSETLADDRADRF